MLNGGMFKKGYTPWNKGKKLPEITGHQHWNFGKSWKWTDEQKVKLKGIRTGEKNGRWITDRTTLQKYGDANQDRRSSAYRDWRKQVWLRDNFKCKIANPDCAGHLEAHHILGWTDYPELRYQLNNGISLCHAHHPRKRAEEKRLSPYFQELVSVSNV